MSSQIKYRIEKTDPKSRFCQGDILKDIEIPIIKDIDNEGNFTVVLITLPYGIIINQECDLEHDYTCRYEVAETKDKHLPNFLILPAYLEEEFKAGTHRGEEMKTQYWNTNLYRPIPQNTNPRFHFLEGEAGCQLPNLVIDFKHLYTMTGELLYKKIKDTYFVSISEMFREVLSQRYSNYLSRIGLPVL